jgi:hypothetical protein
LFLVVTALRDESHTNRRVAGPGESPCFDLAVWGGVLTVRGYAMGRLHERNQQDRAELPPGYDGMMVILHHFLSDEKYPTAHAYRVALYATRIGGAPGLDSASTEDMRTAVLLRNVNRSGSATTFCTSSPTQPRPSFRKACRSRRERPAASPAGGFAAALDSHPDDGAEIDGLRCQHHGRSCGSAGAGAGRRV